MQIYLQNFIKTFAYVKKKQYLCTLFVWRGVGE